jgi:hypothetical protein
VDLFPTGWFWKASDARIYSARAESVVDSSDADYQAFLAGGLAPAAWPLDEVGNQTDEAMAALLAPFGLYLTVEDSLIAYATRKQQQVAQGGFLVNANSGGSPLLVSVDTSPAYANYLSSAAQLAQLMLAGTIPSSNINWVQDSGTVALTPVQVITMGVAVGAQVQQSFTVLGELISEIKSGGVTSREEIDAAGWPANGG